MEMEKIVCNMGHGSKESQEDVWEKIREKDQETAARKPTRVKIQQDERKGVGKDHVDG